MTTPSTMIDTIGADSTMVPTGTKFVGAYVSGTGDVPWTEAEIKRLAGSVIMRIYQGAGTYPGIDGYDELDCETNALSPAMVASEVEKRVQGGYIWTIVYGDDSTLALCAAAIKALGETIWNGHVYCALANWDLSEAEAEALLGTEIHGMTCVMVQWASPTSNPNTLVPGSSMTLAEANVDLSVVDASRLPLPPKVTATGAGGSPAILGMVVYEDASAVYHSVDVTSTDNGTTWLKATSA